MSATIAILYMLYQTSIPKVYRVVKGELIALVHRVSACIRGNRQLAASMNG